MVRPTRRNMKKRWNLPNEFYAMFNDEKVEFWDKIKLMDDATTYHTAAPKQTLGIPFKEMVVDFSHLPLTKRDIMEIYARMNDMGSNSFVWSWEHAAFSHMMPWPTINYMSKHFWKVVE